MAPEQIAGSGSYVGPATDVWALGVLLYLALADAWPFDGSMIELMAQIASANPIPPRQLRRNVSKSLEEVCLRALKADSEQRFPDGEAFLGALNEARDADTLTWRRGALVAALPLLLLAFAIVTSWQSGQPAASPAGAPSGTALAHVTPSSPKASSSPASALSPGPASPDLTRWPK
ncbi:MAG: hypothetical protein JKY65_14330 [Planctomycetes bacterium]|nr:hypothetical protein [Planctomycetota bacterium]